MLILSRSFSVWPSVITLHAHNDVAVDLDLGAVFAGKKHCLIMVAGQASFLDAPLCPLYTTTAFDCIALHDSM